MTGLVSPGSLAELTPGPGAHVAVVDVDGEAILVDEERGQLHLLNPSGALVWSLLDGVSSVGEICDDLADALGVAPDPLATDVAVLVRRFLDADLAVAPGYTRPPLPGEQATCDCGADHGPDEIDRIEIPGNP